MSPSLSERFSALLLYLGAAPFIRAARRRGLSAFLSAHHTAAMGSWFLLCLVFAGLVLAVAGLSVGMILARSVYEHWHLEPYVLDVVWKLFLAWLVVHLFCAGHAALGRTGPLPLVSGLGARGGVRRTVQAMAWTLAVLLLIVGSLTLHASYLTRSDERPGKVYFVYENNGVVPQWVFALGMYRLALASRDCYGPGEAVLLRITRDRLRRAFREGTFVVVGSHGQAQGIIAEKQWFTPQDLKPGDVGLQLRYVYLSGCDSGAQESEWQRALKPAQVGTHNRLTAVVEHAWWLWVTGPKLLREVAHQEASKRLEGTLPSPAPARK